MKNIYSLADEGLPFARTSRLRHFGRNNVLFQSKEIVWRKVPLELWIIAVSLYYFLSLCTWLKIYIKIYFFSQWLIEKYTRIQIDLVKLPAGFRPYTRLHLVYLFLFRQAHYVKIFSRCRNERLKRLPKKPRLYVTWRRNCRRREVPRAGTVTLTIDISMFWRVSERFVAFLN